MINSIKNMTEFLLKTTTSRSTIMFKKTLLTGIITLTALSACSVFAAQENSIRFKGEVASQTCNISVNDSTSAAPVILLQTAKLSELDAVGKTSTPTSFSMKLTGCTSPQAAQDIKVHFATSDYDNDGNLKNIAQNGAENVAIQLLDTAGNAIKLTGGEATVKAFTLNTGESGGEAQYTAQYIATATGAKAGKVEATVQYAVSYL